jgi:RHS repeat-associated protein
MQSIRWAISVAALTLSASIGAAPSVTLVAPVGGERYVAPAAIELAANPAVDAGRSIDRVEFLADGNVIGVATQAPYTVSWANVAKGNYNLRARVYDSTGARDNSPVVRVNVRNNTAPKVRLSAPEHRYIAPGAVPLSATVTDRDDPIAKVEFFNGDVLLSTTAAEPYAFDWTGIPAGDYELRATATDVLGATGSSNIFRVHIRDNAAPHVRILTPDNKETFPAPASIAVSLKANDRDDNLTNVELFANGTSLATFTAAPFEFNWNNVTPGTYTLTAVATDDLGLTTTSRTRTITVTGNPQPPVEKKVYFIHVDHLNTPRLIADEQQRVVWRWDQTEPFGDSVPDENPSGLGTFEFPGRLPGQYFDRETSLHYNYFRDYDPVLGRYAQSDPIGLPGGINTYSYVMSNALLRIDVLGLTPDGCGSGPTRGATPNLWFRDCCDAHDDCYDDCARQPPKAQCDDQFCSCVFRRCSGWANSAACKATAMGYCVAVSTSGTAMNAYNSARSKCRQPSPGCIPSRTRQRASAQGLL